MKKIAIIIINYNGLADTLVCLGSLTKIKRGNYQSQIFVVDYSSDITESQKISKQFPNITVMRHDHNLGFAGGNNLGIKAGLEWGADYLLLLNNDTITNSNFLQLLVHYLDQHTEVGAISPKIYFTKGHEYHKQYKQSEQGKVIWYAGGQLDWHNMYASHLGVDEVDNGQFDDQNDTDFFSGCCVLLRSSILAKTGLFNEKLFLYWEDTDLSLRIEKIGFKVKILPQAHIWHNNAGSSGVGSDLHDYFLQRNRLWFGFRYAPLRTKIALIRQSLVQLLTGNSWTKKAVIDYIFGRMGQGSWS